jgi:CheY-like chemotaxis protein
MLKILVIEDEPLRAAALEHSIELHPCYSVTAIATDLIGALTAVAVQVPDLALVNLELANGMAGRSVAARLHEMDILCLLTATDPPSEQMPHVAIGCLAKPFDDAALAYALTMAENIIRQREKLVRHQRFPDQLQVYPGPLSAVQFVPSERGPVDGFGDPERATCDEHFHNPCLVERISAAFRFRPKRNAVAA